MMDDKKRRWLFSRDRLMTAIRLLGFPDELGEACVKNLGSPKAMDRMATYLMNVKPNSVELVVDEMLAIRSQIEAWRARKDSLEANARYNEVLNYGLGNDDDEEEEEDIDWFGVNEDYDEPDDDEW